MARVHPTALVDSGAELESDVEIGPYSIVGPHVRPQITMASARES
jgi:UDP-N-acetylglucosamine acyltransferase